MSDYTAQDYERAAVEHENAARWLRDRCEEPESEAAPHDRTAAMLRSAARLRQQVETLTTAAKTVHDRFARDEAQGYRSRDRQYAIEILGQALAGDLAPGGSDEGGAARLDQEVERREVPMTVEQTATSTRIFCTVCKRDVVPGHRCES